jgi:hypothetical protein
MTGTRTYDKFPGIIHQLCAAHLLRDLEDAAQSYPGAIWPGQIADAPRALIHAANTARGQAWPPSPPGPAAVPARRSASACPACVGVLAPTWSSRQPGCCWSACATARTTCAGSCLACGFPTSNQAGQDVRPVKIQQKISGRLRSEQATRHQYAIRGYLSTAAEHGISVFAALRDAIAGNSWMPPVLAQT